MAFHFRMDLLPMSFFKGASVCLWKMNCHNGSTIKGEGAWESQYESKECKVCA